MVRPQKIRRIFFQPKATYFKPAGIPLRNLKETILNFDELEALRLIDLKEMEQNKAGKKMKVSQPTLSRLLKTGRKKIINALTNGESIKIKGGNFEMTIPRRGRGMPRGFKAGPEGFCVCPKCKHEEQHQRRIPCYQKKCPKCGALMTRK